MTLCKSLALVSALSIFSIAIPFITGAACYQTQTYPPQTICNDEPEPAPGGVTDAGCYQTQTYPPQIICNDNGVGNPPAGLGGSPPQGTSGAPVANWRFEDSGSSVLDSSGNGNNGLLENGAGRIAGTQGGNKLILDGVDDRVIISPVSANASNMTAFTLMAWIRPSANSGIILRKGNQDLGRFNFGLTFDGRLFLRVGYTAQTGAWTTAQTLAHDTWTHVAVSYPGGTGADPVFYIDGAAVTQTEVSTPAGDVAPDSSYLYIGNNQDFVNRSQGGSSAFMGRMDDVRIYNSALPGGAIASAMTPEPDLASYVPLPMPSPSPTPAPPPPAPGIVTSPPEPAPLAICPNLSRTLSYGVSGNDVGELQKFLIWKGHLAKGNDTGFFGALTQAAVQKFQCAAMGLCSGSPSSNGYGVVGPQTRSSIAIACGIVPPSEVESSATTGWVEKISTGDGVIRGWAADKNSQSPITVNIYADGNANSKGVFVGSTLAYAIHKGAEWQSGIPGNHGFSFQIPNQYFDSRSHTFTVEPIDAQGRPGPMLGAAQSSVTLLYTGGRAPRSLVTDASCLDGGSRCVSFGSDYLAPNFSVSSGKDDGVNYFNTWQCSSASGINHITKVNIIPYGTHGNLYQKDSLFLDASLASTPGTLLYFTSSSYDHGSTFRLKKAAYSPSENKWNIHSVLDNPLSAGGVSSQDGRGTSFIMNDYSLPGWGPSSPVSGSQTLVPGVSNTSAGAQIGSYPLVGTGPLGITAVMNALHPSTVSGGVEGRTCIHMNPKLFDYDAQGRPQSMLVNLWQNTISEACPLPPGAPITKLPAPGTYIYRYQGATLGWQLDLAKGLVKDSATNDSTNRLSLVYKPINGSRMMLAATWDGEVVQMNLDAPAASNATKLLDCSAPGVHLGEATGNADGFYFLASPPGQPLYLSQSPDVFYADIYYASKR